MFHCEWNFLGAYRLDNLNNFLEPGMLVKHPLQPDWGIGQVQSRIDNRITVNFTEVGKIVIDGSRIVLVQVLSKD
jgi:hypothetical protein